MNKINKLLNLIDESKHTIPSLNDNSKEAILDYLQNSYSEDTDSSAIFYLKKEFNITADEASTIILRYNMLTPKEKINISTEDLKNHIF
jgi:hypothetical protein